MTTRSLKPALVLVPLGLLIAAPSGCIRPAHSRPASKWGNRQYRSYGGRPATESTGSGGGGRVRTASVPAVRRRILAKSVLGGRYSKWRRAETTKEAGADRGPTFGKRLALEGKARKPTKPMDPASRAGESLAKPKVAMTPPPGTARRRGTPKARPRPTVRGVPVIRLIIYSATLRIEVADKDESMEKAQKLAEALGGHLQSRNAYRVVLRIPAKKFFEAMKKFSDLGEVYQKEMRTQDVTEAYLDLRIRLRTTLSVLKRMRELLQRAKNVKEALKVEREIARLVEKIERLKGRIRYLKQLAAMSTFIVYFTTPNKRPRLRLPPHRRSPFPWVRRLGIRSMLYFRR
jgi:hypothetical protein